MKILITGVNGQVGSSLVEKAKTHGYQVEAISRKEWDMALSPELGENLVLKSNPDLVINPAAYTNVDDAESDEATALRVNSEAPKALSKACALLNIPIFHLSTDYVFDGKKNQPYLETDITRPINAYGRTKLAGEYAVKEETEKYIILRTSWVFSKKGKNFMNTIINKVKDCNVLKIVDDQIGSPTSADSISELLINLCENHKQLWGTYHFSGQTDISWYEFAKIIFNNVNKNEDFRVNLHPCSSYEYITRAPRPKNTTLNIDKIKKITSVRKYELSHVIHNYDLYI